ncbi:hypothetical protein IH992_20065 [Candidatus Poribacteria bacterium]|nr:hypothetical protein [Candidatus Poribacteria bacterium]
MTEGEGRVGTEEVESTPYIQVKELENPEDAEPYIDPLSKFRGVFVAIDFSA